MSKPPRAFEPRVNILPAAQRRLWPELRHTPSHFTLYGGTALALRLAHRQSIVFDFLTGKPVSGAKLLQQLAYLQRAKVRQLEPNTLTCSVQRSGAVRLSFFGGLSLGQVDPAEAAHGPLIMVASLRDIAGTKLSVVTQRAEAKDYIDIHALLTEARLPLAEMLGCARAIFGSGFDPLHSLKALAYHDDPGLVGLKPSIKRDLLAAIRTVDASRLPAIKPLRRPKTKT
jgi:hypothetical protein